MVFCWADSFLYAVNTCLLAFSIVDITHSLPTAPITLNHNCTDCCDLLSCMGLDHVQTSTNVTDFTDILCSKKNIAIMPTCYTKHNLNHCSYMKKLVSKIPSTDKMAEGYTQFCNHKEEMKALSSCLINSGIALDVYHRCTVPYTRDMKDKDSDVCETIDTNTRCVLTLIKTTNCSDIIGTNYEQSMKLQKQNNPFCTNASAQMCNVLYLVIISFVLIWNKMALKI